MEQTDDSAAATRQHRVSTRSSLLEILHRHRASDVLANQLTKGKYLQKITTFNQHHLSRLTSSTKLKPAPDVTGVRPSFRWKELAAGGTTPRVSSDMHPASHGSTSSHQPTLQRVRLQFSRLSRAVERANIARFLYTGLSLSLPSSPTWKLAKTLHQSLCKFGNFCYTATATPHILARI